MAIYHAYVYELKKWFGEKNRDRHPVVYYTVVNYSERGIFIWRVQVPT